MFQPLASTAEIGYNEGQIGESRYLSAFQGGRVDGRVEGASTPAIRAVAADDRDPRAAGRPRESGETVS